MNVESFIMLVYLLALVVVMLFANRILDWHEKWVGDQKKVTDPRNPLDNDTTNGD